MELSRKTMSKTVLAAAVAGICTLPMSIQAADHREAPKAQANTSADIGDYYAWHADGVLNLILTFGTFAPAGAPGAYDSTLLYSFHFDTTADNESDLDIHARFAMDDDGDWGVQISGIGDEALEGEVENVLVGTNLTAWAGVADDPFFFDQSGFQDTVATGTLSFDPESDDVAGFNVTAIAIQAPLSSVAPDSGAFQTWATTNQL